MQRCASCSPAGNVRSGLCHDGARVLNTARRHRPFGNAAAGHVVRASPQDPSSAEEAATTMADAAIATVRDDDRSVVPTRLNNIPHQRSTRDWFYADVSDAVIDALQAGQKRIQVRVTIPETNPEQDVFRIGTVLEMVRWLIAELVADGSRAKVCVQQSMGQGVFQGMPLSLSGVRRIMDRMDWGDMADFVTFGSVGADQIDDCAAYVLISPQNVVGSTIMKYLKEMADEAEKQGKAIILVNPLLKDVPSAGGVMGVRGRDERMAIARSFTSAYHFRLLYWPGTYFPIVGALRYRYGKPWQLYKRVDTGKQQEKYELCGEFDSEPSSEAMTDALYAEERKKTKAKTSWW